MKTIELYNRYGYDVYLEKIKANTWKLVMNLPEWEPYRLIGKEGSEGFDDPYAIDPPGGPFLNVGYQINEFEKIKAFVKEDNQWKVLTEDI